MGVFDLRPVGQYWIILMELVKGDSLSATPIRDDEVKRLFGSLADAVSHMVQANVVHRDLKPDNIVVRRSDRSPVIVDLGLSVDTTVFDPKAAGFAGSPVFMPPEATDGVITNAFDAYSLGVTAAKVLTGNYPSLPGGIGELFGHKKSGRFREELLAMLRGTDEAVARWIGGLTDDDLKARLAALEDGRAWVTTPTAVGGPTARAKKPWWRFW